jgi:hypothetical protein
MSLGLKSQNFRTLDISNPIYPYATYPPRVIIKIFNK